MNKENNKFLYDAIVIGSGIGGLSTAGFLSKVNKKRVLVLEKHYEIGGLTHEFKRGPYSWDVGLHYMGNMEKRLLDILGSYFFKFLSNNRLKWNKMPETFEKLMFPGFNFDIKESLKDYKNELLNKFPHEKKAINKYLTDVHILRLWYLLFFFSKFFHPPMSQLFKLLSFIFRKKALMTTGDYMKKNFTDEKLKAVLIARWGNYGLPPAESSFAVHALTEHHYYTGGIFPDGGAENIAAFFEDAIEESGGRILISREVTEIIIENGKAIGVKAVNLSSAGKNTETYYAPVIISDAGAHNTYLKLMPKNLNFPIQKELAEFHPGYSGLNVYLGLKDSPEKLGIKGENYWIMDGFELDIFEKKHGGIITDKASYCFLSFPSLKSGKRGAHTADIVTIFPYDFFRKWENSNWKERSNEYYELKDKIIDNLLQLVDKYIPGFSKLVVYREISTPLTFRHFTDKANGTFYGIPSVPARFKLKGLEVKTPVKGLFLTGSDLLCNGVFPTLFTGMATASYLNGPVGSLKIILKALLFNPEKQEKNSFYNPADTEKFNDEKTKTLLINKKIKNNIVELTYQFKNPLNLIPGQHVKLQVSDSVWRAYSIAKVDNNNLTLIIDIKLEGAGANYAGKIQIFDKSVMRLPVTDLVYHESDRALMFIATGTGIVPFLYIMDELKKKNKIKKIVVLFGCMNDEDNFIDEYLKPYEKFFTFEKHIYVENACAGSRYIKGRVTDMLKSGSYNFNEYDFYVCGHPHMTQAVIKYLRNGGANKIYW